MKRKITIRLIPRTYLLMISCCLLLMNTQVFAQNAIQAKGAVIDQSGLPIPGATIIIKGTTLGTVSDMDGNYTIDCTLNDSLIISFIGYLSENLIVSNANLPSLTLIEDIARLSEVVVVGYGTMRKEDLTGAITSVSSEDLHQGVVTSTEQVLQGKVAGLTVIKGSGDPTQGATMRLRGGTSLIANSSPLVVVDGIAGVDINTVQPSDIESIDVLKDASAAAIYGSRGANGVIIITTTRPQKGQKVEYSNYFAFGSPANTLDMLSADQWRAKVVEYEETKAIDFEGNTNWQEEVTRNSFSQSHSLSFSGATDGGGYRASVNYLSNQGVIKTSELERIGASVSAYTTTLNDKLRFDIGTHTTLDKYRPVNEMIYERIYTVNPTAPVYDSLGNFFQVDAQNSQNPVELLENEYNHPTRKRLLGYAKAELEIIDGLKASANGSYEYNSQQGRYYQPTYSFLGQSSRGYANRSLGDYTTMQLETFLTYNKEFATGHRLNLLGGYSYLDNTYEGFSAERRDFDTDLFLYNNLGSGLDYRADDVSSYKGNSKLISFFGRVNYSYLGKYTFTATVRRDGSSRFGEHNKWGIFPSFAAGWKISDESFLDFSDNWLNHMKIRAGYGVTGSQDAIGEYKTIALLGTQGGKYYDPISSSWKASYSPVQNANPDLKWETTSQINFGVDFSILNRLSGTLDVYNKLTEDLIFMYSVPQPPSLYHETLFNFGELSNKGVELALNWNIINQNDLRWDLNFTMAKNTMVIEKLNDKELNTDAVPSGSLHGLPGMSNQFSQTIREGYAVGTFWGLECSGLNAEGEFLNVNGDPLDIQDDSLYTDLGNAQPKFSMGLNTGLSYKGIDFSVSTYGIFGQKVLNATGMVLNSQQRFPEQNVPNRLFEEGITDEPIFSSYYVEDASFFRLQALTLGYTFRFENIGISKLRLYATAENLFVITKYKGLDPEIDISGLENPGIDRFNVYPRPKTISVGLSVAF